MRARGADVETLRALEEALRDFPGSVMVISHDRWFLDRLCNETIAFEGDSKVLCAPPTARWGAALLMRPACCARRWSTTPAPTPITSWITCDVQVWRRIPPAQSTARWRRR